MMPDATSSLKSSSQQRRNPKPFQERFALRSRPDSDDDSGAMVLPTKKILVICNDPDATESSSDDEERVQPKRHVTEIFIPADCSFSIYDSDDDLRKTWNSVSLCSISRLSAFHLSDKGCSSQLKAACPRKISAKKLPVRSKRKGISHPKKTSRYAGVRRQGKWAAENRDSATGAKRWLGTYDSAQAAARAYDMAAKKIRGPQSSSNLTTFGVCLYSSTNSLNDGTTLESSFQNGFMKTPCCAIMVDEHDLDYSSAMNSPSSVLDNTLSEACDSPRCYEADKACSEFVSNGCLLSSGISEGKTARRGVLVEGDSFQRAEVSEGSSIVLEGMTNGSSMKAPSFLEEPILYDDFGPFFDIEGNRSSQRYSVTVPVCDELTVNEDGLGDLPWDLDGEVLAWISVPEACGV